MYTEKIELQTAAINETKQIEVVYFVIGLNDGIEVSRRREGMVWQPGSNLAADTVSGTLSEVQSLANTFWTPEVIAAYQAAQAATESARNA
jgi:hypothetical protein